MQRTLIGHESLMWNACTIDVEDYYQVSAFERVISRSDWGGFESRVARNTGRVLEILGNHEVRATFFVLGCVAERHPQLVRDIQQAGHEIASHSFDHRLVYELDPDEFRQDIHRSKDALEQITGQPVRAYRAPSFSITKRSLHALEILVEEGISVDSSVFPIHHDRYGIPNAPQEPYRIRTRCGELLEFPPSVLRVMGWNVPVAGGGYFRLYPYAATQSCVRRINRMQRPVNLYLHPWEFDPEQPRVEGVSRLSRFRHYVNLKSTGAKFSRLLTGFQFSSMSDVVGKLDCGALRTFEVANGTLTETTTD